MNVFLDFFGIAVFAVSGALAAGRYRLDVFGVVVVALIACLGGGTLRDVNGVDDRHGGRHTSEMCCVTRFRLFFIKRSMQRPHWLAVVCIWLCCMQV